MVTASQAVVAAYATGIVGVLLGIAIAATYRADARRRNPGPSARLDELLRDALDDEADRLAAEWERREGDR